MISLQLSIRLYVMMTVIKNIEMSRLYNIEQSGVQLVVGGRVMGQHQTISIGYHRTISPRCSERLYVHLPHGYISESGQGRELFYSNCDKALTCGNKHVDKHRNAFLGPVRHCYSTV